MSKKKAGILKCTSLVASNMIGSGALLAPMVLAPYGSWALIGWVITAIGALALSLCFSKLSEWIPGAGGPYTYVQRVFGDFMGYQISWGYWFSTWCGSASLVIGALQYISIFFPEISTSSCISIPLGLAMIWAFTFVNMRGISESMTVSVVILVLKTIPLILFAIVGVFFFNPDMAFAKLEMPKNGYMALCAMAQPLLWSFMGLESATVPGDHIDNPKRTIPIATVSGVLITAMVYIVGAIVISGVLPHSELIASKAPYVDAGAAICGNFGELFMMITGIIGLVGSLNGWILIHGQVAKSAAESGLFPKLFAKENKHGAPVGVFIGSVCMSILFILSYTGSLSSQINTLIDLSVFAMVLPYFYCVAAVICLFVTKKNALSCGEKVVYNIVIGIAFLYTFFSIFSAGASLISYGFLAMLIITPLYLCVRKN